MKKRAKNKNTGNAAAPQRIALLILFAFAFLLYGNSVLNEFAFDDSIVVTKNELVKSGTKGIKGIFSSDLLTGMYGKQLKMYSGGRYRPLSLAMFAIEYQFFGENPHVNHFLNVLFYALTGVLIYLILLRLFRHKRLPKSMRWSQQFWYLGIPFITTLIYIAHPLHTEAVANVKGRDEIMSFLGALAALWFALKYLEKQQIKHIIFSSLSLFLGLLSKENAITFLAVIPLSIYFFSDKPFKKSIPVLVSLLLTALVFLRIRSGVLGNTETQIAETLMTNSFLEMNLSQRYATIFLTLTYYIKLLFVPHPLTFDYYAYHIPMVNWFDWRSVLGVLMYTGMGIFAVLKFKQKSIISYGIFFFLATFSIVSNVFFSVGVFMSERFMYAPSLGFSLLFVFLLMWVLSEFIKTHKTYKYLIYSLFGIILLLFSVKTITRNPVWKNSFTLFTTDVKTSKNSFKSNAAAGEKYIFLARKTKDETERYEAYQLAIKYFSKVIEIFPDYIYVLNYLAEANFEWNQDIKKSVYYWRRILEVNPDYDDVYTNLERTFKAVKGVDYKIKVYEDFYTLNPNRFEINYNLGILYGAFKNDLKQALPYLQRAYQLKPNDLGAITDLATAYGYTGQSHKAIELLEKALTIQKDNPQIYNNLAAAYDNIGNKQKANEMRQIAKKIKKN